MRSDAEPLAKDLSKQDAYDWTMNYLEYKYGNITEAQLEEDQREIARLYRVHTDGRPQGNERLVGNEPAKQGKTDQAKGPVGTDTEAGHQSDTVVAELTQRATQPDGGKAAIDALLSKAEPRPSKLHRLNREALPRGTR